LVTSEANKGKQSAGVTPREAMALRYRASSLDIGGGRGCGCGCVRRERVRSGRWGEIWWGAEGPFSTLPAVTPPRDETHHTALPCVSGEGVWGVEQNQQALIIPAVTLPPQGGSLHAAPPRVSDPYTFSVAPGSAPPYG
jgi:hypothetical protein